MHTSRGFARAPAIVPICIRGCPEWFLMGLLSAFWMKSAESGRSRVPRQADRREGT